MHSQDRPEFETALAQLFAGFPGSGVQTQARVEAYWKGLARMNLIEFNRLVEFCLGEAGPDRLPSVPQLWRLRSSMRTPALPKETGRPEIPDHLEFFSNRLLWAHLRARGGLGSVGRFVAPHGLKDVETASELAQLLAARRDLVAEFAQYVRERDELATPAEFCRRWARILERVSKPAPKHLEMLIGFRRSQNAAIPFAASMARPNPLGA